MSDPIRHMTAIYDSHEQQIVGRFTAKTEREVVLAAERHIENLPGCETGRYGIDYSEHCTQCGVWHSPEAECVPCSYCELPHPSGTACVPCMDPYDALVT